MEQRQSSGFNEVYGGLAKIGRITSLIKFIVAIIISLGLGGTGIWLFVRKEIRSVVTKARVDSVEKVAVKSSKKDRVMYKISFAFDLSDATYTGTGQRSMPIAKGDLVDVEYEPENPSNNALDGPSGRTVAYILWAFSVFILVSSGIWYFIVSKSKLVAAADGAGDVFSLVSGNPRL